MKQRRYVLLTNPTGVQSREEKARSFSHLFQGAQRQYLYDIPYRTLDRQTCFSSLASQKKKRKQRFLIKMRPIFSKNLAFIEDLKKDMLLRLET